MPPESGPTPAMLPFTLQTDRLSLTPFAQADLPELHALFTNPSVRRYLMDDLIVDETWRLMLLTEA